MGGSGGPSPKGKQIDEAIVVSVAGTVVAFNMEIEDASYFEEGKKYKLIAIERDSERD